MTGMWRFCYLGVHRCPARMHERGREHLAARYTAHPAANHYEPLSSPHRWWSDESEQGQRASERALARSAAQAGVQNLDELQPVGVRQDSSRPICWHQILPTRSCLYEQGGRNLGDASDLRYRPPCGGLSSRMLHCSLRGSPRQRPPSLDLQPVMRILTLNSMHPRLRGDPALTI